MCIRRETQEKSQRCLAFSRVSKPHTHITHMLRQCTSIVYLCDLNLNFPFVVVHFILNKPAFSDHLSYLAMFQCSIGRPHKTDFTVPYRRRIYLFKSKVMCNDFFFFRKTSNRHHPVFNDCKYALDNILYIYIISIEMRSIFCFVSVCSICFIYCL